MSVLCVPAPLPHTSVHGRTRLGRHAGLARQAAAGQPGAGLMLCRAGPLKKAKPVSRADREIAPPTPADAGYGDTIWGDESRLNDLPATRKKVLEDLAYSEFAIYCSARAQLALIPLRCRTIGRRSARRSEMRMPRHELDSARTPSTYVSAVKNLVKKLM